VHGLDPDRPRDPYAVVVENDRVRVLEYRDAPGARTHVHRHPDSVMVTLSRFRRRLSVPGEVSLTAGHARRLDARSHLGENIGDTDLHAISVELKDGGGTTAAVPGALGPG
jgi:beta-alanine degradation protein BauB